MSITRDRELADTLYALVDLAEQLKLDLNLLIHGLQESHHAATGLAVVGGKSSQDVASALQPSICGNYNCNQPHRIDACIRRQRW